jgi:hypothetical protein
MRVGDSAVDPEPGGRLFSLISPLIIALLAARAVNML